MLFSTNLNYLTLVIYTLAFITEPGRGRQARYVQSIFQYIPVPAAHNYTKLPQFLSHTIMIIIILLLFVRVFALCFIVLF